MKLSLTLAAIATTALSLAGNAAAQSYNPNQTYANPDNNQTQIFRSRGPCGDPWVTIALINVYGKAEPSKCNVSLYNGGRWNSFNQLVHSVGKLKNAPLRIDLDLTRLLYQCPTPSKCTLYSKNKFQVGRLENGQLMVVVPSVIGQNGANVIGQNGASIIGDQGSGIVANNGARLIANAIQANPPVSPFSGYALQGVNDFRALRDKTRK